MLASPPLDVLEIAAGEAWEELDYPRASIKMLAVTPIERKYRVRACAKEPWTAAWIETMEEGDTLLHIGASTGPYVLLAAALGRLAIAIEPSPASYYHLTRNILINRYGERIVPLALAVGGATSLRQFACRTIEAGAAGHEFDRAGETTLPTLCVTLDDLLAEFGLPFPSHILIDVDGNEVEVLTGAPETLRDPRVTSVLIETPDQEPVAARVATLIEAGGFVQTARHDQRGGQRIQGVFYAEYRRA